jgi:hypothetical protein
LVVDALDDELLDELSEDVDEVLSLLEPAPSLDPGAAPELEVLFEDDVDDRLSVL